MGLHLCACGVGRTLPTHSLPPPARAVKEKMSADYETTIVVDNGSGMLKAGWAGADLPEVIIPSVIGEPFFQDDPNEEVLYVGEGVAPLAGAVKIRYPLAHGKATRWDDLELLWDHTFDMLNAEPAAHPVLLTEPPPTFPFRRCSLSMPLAVLRALYWTAEMVYLMLYPFMKASVCLMLSSVWTWPDEISPTTCHVC